MSLSFLMRVGLSFVDTFGYAGTNVRLKYKRCTLIWTKSGRVKNYFLSSLMYWRYTRKIIELKSLGKCLIA
jgi:hypothetical protein